LVVASFVGVASLGSWFLASSVAKDVRDVTAVTTIFSLSAPR
jgi:hypothetical protein